MGLPWEGLPPRRVPRGPLSHALLPGRHGMVSDDTEHALFTLLAAREALSAPDPPVAFQRALRRRFVSWFLAAPPSLGRATLRAGWRAALGMHVTGVRSIGNGPLMRAAILGAMVADSDLRWQLTDISTGLTHLEAIPAASARLVAEAVAGSAEGVVPIEWLTEQIGREPLLAEDVGGLVEALQRGITPESYLRGVLPRPERGVPGMARTTLLAALACWASWPESYERMVREAIRLGGDTDTVAAVAGALAAARPDPRIPAVWLDGIQDVYSISWLRQAANVGTGMPPFPLRAARNVFQTAVVLGHAMVVRPVRATVQQTKRHSHEA